MSYKAYTSDSNKKDWKDRSRKLCCCGGHSNKDVKKNLNHNGTKQKYLIRLARKQKFFNLVP